MTTDDVLNNWLDHMLKSHPREMLEFIRHETPYPGDCPVCTSLYVQLTRVRDLHGDPS